MVGHCCNKSEMFHNCFNKEEICLRDRFRLLWEQHVYWTRMTIISMVHDLPDAQATTNRLLRNPTDFARLFCCFYGTEVASEFERLLRDHLVIAAELVKAAKAGNSSAAASAEKRWYQNADEIVSFLNQINPYWDIECMKPMWYKHLELTKSEAVARLNKKYTKDIAIFNEIEKEALKMADFFSWGIAIQFKI